MRTHQICPAGARRLGGPRVLVLAIALVASALPAGNALAAYVFTGGGTATGTATGDAAVTTLYLEEFSGLIYHSTDGSVFSPDWGGGLFISAVPANTINVSLSTGDGSVLILGGVLSPASALQAAIAVVSVANTANQVVIDDTGNSAAVTYTVDTLPGTITAPGINFNQSGSAAFRGGVTLQGSSGGDTFNVASICCAGANHEPVSLVAGPDNDTFLIPGPLLTTLHSQLTINAGGGVNTLDFTGLTDALAIHLAAGSVTGVTNLTAINIQSVVGGDAADAITVVPSASTVFTIGGGLPTTCPGDSLTIDLTGVTAPVVNTPSGTGAGQITFGNRAAVNYSGIESLTPTTATVGGAQAICAGGTTAGLGGNTPIIGVASWSVFSGGTGTFSPDPSDPNATFTHDTGTGPIVLQWTIATAPCAASSADVTVTINPIPGAPTAGNGGPYQLGETISLTASTVPGATYAWTGPDAFSSTDQNPTIPNATAAMFGTYSVTATVNGCVSPAGTTQVTGAAPIPALSGLGLMALGLALAAAGALLLKRKVLG